MAIQILNIFPCPSGQEYESLTQYGLQPHFTKNNVAEAVRLKFFFRWLKPTIIIVSKSTLNIKLLQPKREVGAGRGNTQFESSDLEKGKPQQTSLHLLPLALAN